MATIIQNMACFEVEINAQNQRIYFDEDILRGKKINQIFFYYSLGGRMLSPFQSPQFEDIEPNDFLFDSPNFGIYFNLYSPNGNHFCKNLFVRNVDLGGLNHSFRQSYVELDIQQVLDTKKSYLSVFLNNPVQEKMKALVLATYENRPIRMQDITITGSKTIEIPSNGFEPIGVPFIQDFKLSDLGIRDLSNKTIKKITGASAGYLYLKTRNGLIEYLPSDFLDITGVREFYFDNLIIDFDKSFFLRRSLGSARDWGTRLLTFYY